MKGIGRAWASFKAQLPSAGTSLALPTPCAQDEFMCWGGGLFSPTWRHRNMLQMHRLCDAERRTDTQMCRWKHTYIPSSSRCTGSHVQTPRTMLSPVWDSHKCPHDRGTGPHTYIGPQYLKEPVIGLYVISPVSAPRLQVAQRPSSHRPETQDAHILIQRGRPPPQHLKTTETVKTDSGVDTAQYIGK